jgi:hypothetical protein
VSLEHGIFHIVILMDDACCIKIRVEEKGCNESLEFVLFSESNSMSLTQNKDHYLLTSSN